MTLIDMMALLGGFLAAWLVADLLVRAYTHLTGRSF